MTTTEPFPHGTDRGHSRGCRLECCKAAHRDYVRAWRLRTGRTVAPRPRPIARVLEARAEVLALTIARAPQSRAAAEARVRRDEVLALLAHFTGQATR